MRFTNLNTSTLGQVYHFPTLAEEFKKTMTVEDFEAIFTAAGMTGQKYRNNFSRLIINALKAKLGAAWIAYSAENKRAVFTAVVLMIAMMLGVAGSQRVLVKNMAAHMDARSAKEDYMSTAYSIITDCMVNYVSQATMTKMPSIKFASCHADYCFVGVCMLLSEVSNTQAVRDSFLDAAGTVKAFNIWDDCWKKQWVANLNIDSAFQAEHKAYAKELWEDVITTTMNSNNKNFEKDKTKRWKEEWYEKSEEDDIPIRTHELAIITAPTAGYTKTEFVNVAMLLVEHFRATALGVSGNTAKNSTDFPAEYGAGRAGTAISVTDYLNTGAGISCGVAGSAVLSSRATP